jgi:hypothetical protein
VSAYTDRVDAARNKGGNLFRQTMFSVWKAAYDITNESVGTQYHAARLAWATKLRFGGISAAESFADRVLPQVLENATIQAAPEAATDNDVQFVVNALINSWIDKG